MCNGVERVEGSLWAVGCVASLVAVQAVGGPTLRYPSRGSGRKAAKRSVGSHREGGGRGEGVTIFTTALGVEMAKILLPDVGTLTRSDVGGIVARRCSLW